MIWGDRHWTDPLSGQGDGNDEIYGGAGNDDSAAAGHDNLFGEDGYNDRLYGQDGDDFLYAGPDGGVLDGGANNNFLAQNDLSNWPNALPWPELNLFAETTEVVDDQGPNWYAVASDTEGTQWLTQEDEDAFGGSQSVLEVKRQPLVWATTTPDGSAVRGGTNRLRFM